MKLTRKQTTWKNKFGADLWVYKVNRKEGPLKEGETEKAAEWAKLIQKHAN